MCEYSMHNLASRPARIGDELITTRFGTLLGRGFCAVGEPDLAVCLQPGTEIAFKKEEVTFDHWFAFVTIGFLVGKVREKVASFRQINLDCPHCYHDALEFSNGKVVLVSRLCLGQRATVLQLPASAPGAKQFAVKALASEHAVEKEVVQ